MVEPQFVPGPVRLEKALEVAGDTLLHRQPALLLELRPAHLRKEPEHHAAEELFLGQTEQPDGRRVPVGDPPLPIQCHEAVAEVLEHREQPLFTVDDGGDCGGAGLLDEDGAAMRRGGHLDPAAHEDGRAAVAGKADLLHDLGD